MVGILLSTREVAEKYGVLERDVLTAAKRGKIPGRKVGWNWVFVEAELPSTWPINRRRK